MSSGVFRGIVCGMVPKRGSDFPEYLTLRLDPRTRKKLEELAKEERRSLGAMTRIVIDEGLAAREGKKTKKKG